MDIVERLRLSYCGEACVACEAADLIERLTADNGYTANALGRAEAEIERLTTENWQLRQACGYPIPADKETPQNPFKCGVCDARNPSYAGGQVEDGSGHV